MKCMGSARVWDRDPHRGAKFRQAGRNAGVRQDQLTPLSQEMLWNLVDEFAALEKQLAYYQEKLEAWPRRLLSVSA